MSLLTASKTLSFLSELVAFIVGQLFERFTHLGGCCRINFHWDYTTVVGQRARLGCSIGLTSLERAGVTWFIPIPTSKIQTGTDGLSHFVYLCSCSVLPVFPRDRLFVMVYDSAMDVISQASGESVNSTLSAHIPFCGHS